MSQSAVESVLGRLLTDFEFRRLFFADSVGASDLALTPRERAAVLRIGLAAVQDFASRLDPTIVRASVGNVRQTEAHALFVAERRQPLSRIRARRE